jgi:hypothetical protein
VEAALVVGSQRAASLRHFLHLRMPIMSKYS